MVLTYLAHACFKLEVAGKICIFDPYKYRCFNGALGYEKIDERPDIVLVSHQHDDHNGTFELKGDFKVIDAQGDYEIDSIVIRGISSFHDNDLGRQRGRNIVFIVSDGKISVAHLGDQGCIDSNLISELAGVDVVLIPVGGTYTLGPKEATEFINLLKEPKLIIPMHYKTDKLGFPIRPVEDFLKLNSDKKQKELGSAVLDLDQILPVEGKQIVVMEHTK